MCKTYGMGALLKNTKEINKQVLYQILVLVRQLNIIKLAVLKLVYKFNAIPNQNTSENFFFTPIKTFKNSSGRENIQE